MPRGTTRACAALAACGSLLAFAPTASAIDEVNTQRFRQQVTVSGILAHERAFQRIANTNSDTRASGTPGYDASVAYVRGRLERAGYDVTEQEFAFPFYRENSSSLTQASPTATTYETAPYEFSGSGDVTGTVVPVRDNQIPPGATPSSSNAGCEAEDFVPASATEDQIALIQRGTCTFRVKADNAFAAGYDAVIIFNEGQAGRQDLFTGTLSPPQAAGPVLGLSFADGAALQAATTQGPVTVRAAADVEYDPNGTTRNLLAETPGGDADRTVVVGAHLDSVTEGPGINDNGSGSAGILEIAEEMADNDVNPRNKVRFAFWGAEESGLLGSEHYVSQLGDDELGSIFANLNFDMIGSPNYVRFVYDGDGSNTAAPGDASPGGPPGSAQIEDLFLRYFAEQNLPTEPTAFDGRSDYGPFIAVGIPAGGLFSGAEVVKTAEQAAVYGGRAGVAYDPCYHQACDDITNLNTRALFELGDGAAHAVLTLARTRSGFFEDGSRAARRAATGRRAAGLQAQRAMSRRGHAFIR